MMSSDGAVGRRGWAFATAKLCFLCGKGRPAVCCQEWDSIVKFLEEEDRYRPVWPKPQLVAVCKDCCIGPLDGHRCPWWDFCWRT